MSRDLPEDYYHHALVSTMQAVHEHVTGSSDCLYFRQPSAEQLLGWLKMRLQLWSDTDHRYDRAIKEALLACIEDAEEHGLKAERAVPGCPSRLPSD